MMTILVSIRSASCVRFMPDSYAIKAYNNNEKLQSNYIWKLTAELIYEISLRITSGSCVRYTFDNYVIKPCKWNQKIT